MLLHGDKLRLKMKTNDRLEDVGENAGEDKVLIKGGELRKGTC